MIEKSRLLSDLPGLNHGFATRHFGRVRTKSGLWPDILANRLALVAAGGFQTEDAVMLNQVHGNVVLKINRADRNSGMLPGGRMLADADAMITDDPGTVLIIRTADCVPLLLCDPVRRVVGVAHAGWKGTSLNVAGALISGFRKLFGSDPSDVRVALGPCIRACHYDVSAVEDDRVAVFDRLFPASGVVVRHGTNVALDLAEANRQQCLAAGVQVVHVELHADCTVDRVDRWASFRGGDRTLDHQIWSFVGMTT